MRRPLRTRSAEVESWLRQWLGIDLSEHRVTNVVVDLDPTHLATATVTYVLSEGALAAAPRIELPADWHDTGKGAP